MKDNNENIQIINFERVKEINFSEKITNTNDWVLCGEDNLYFNHIENMLEHSSIHKAIIESKVNYIFGGGLIKDYPANPDESMNDIIKKIIYDYVIFGGYSINVVKTNGGNNAYYHIPIQKIRSGKKILQKNGIQMKVEEYFYSNNWSKYRQNEFKPISIPAYNSNSKELSKLFVYNNYSVNAEYYPIPSYSSGLKYISIDGEIANFWENSLLNGMSPSLSVTFIQPDPEPDEKRRVKRKVEETYTGSKNAGRIIVNFVESVDQKPIIDTIEQPQLDKQFNVLKTLVTDNIVYAHQLTSPLLAGIKTPGQLGGNNELITSYSIYNQNVIKPYRDDIMNNIIKLTGNKKLELMIVDPISFQFSESIMEKIMTKDEIRAKIGLEPIDIIEQTLKTDI